VPQLAASQPSGVPASESLIPKYGGVLRLANRDDPTAAFDPMKSTTANLHHISSSIYGSGNLVRLCRENIYDVCTGLAENLHRPGGEVGVR
jgi:hypothetical protein